MFEKKIKVLLLTLLLMGSMLSFVSAATTPSPIQPIADLASGFITSVVNFINPIFKYLIGDNSNDPDIFLGKVLLFLLLLSITWVVLAEVNFFDDHNVLLAIVCAVISILGIRFLDNATIKTIILPYSTFGVAITAGLPFILYFLFIERRVGSPLGRRVAWLFFAVIFIFLFFMRLDELKKIGWIYLVTTIAAFAMMAFDGMIQTWWHAARRQRIEGAGKASVRNTLLTKQLKVHQDYANLLEGYTSEVAGLSPTVTGQAAYEADLAALDKALKRLK